MVLCYTAFVFVILISNELLPTAAKRELPRRRKRNLPNTRSFLQPGLSYVKTYEKSSRPQEFENSILRKADAIVLFQPPVMPERKPDSVFRDQMLPLLNKHNRLPFIKKQLSDEFSRESGNGLSLLTLFDNNGMLHLHKRDKSKRPNSENIKLQSKIKNYVDSILFNLQPNNDDSSVFKVADDNGDRQKKYYVDDKEFKISFDANKDADNMVYKLFAFQNNDKDTKRDVIGLITDDVADNYDALNNEAFKTTNENKDHFGKAIVFTDPSDNKDVVDNFIVKLADLTDKENPNIAQNNNINNEAFKLTNLYKDNVDKAALLTDVTDKKANPSDIMLKLTNILENTNPSIADNHKSVNNKAFELTNENKDDYENTIILTDLSKKTDVANDAIFKLAGLMNKRDPSNGENNNLLNNKFHEIKYKDILKNPVLFTDLNNKKDADVLFKLTDIIKNINANVAFEDDEVNENNDYVDGKSYKTDFAGKVNLDNVVHKLKNSAENKSNLNNLAFKFSDLVV